MYLHQWKQSLRYDIKTNIFVSPALIQKKGHELENNNVIFNEAKY